MKHFKKWSERRNSTWVFVLVLIPAGALFVLLFPYLFLVALPRLDARLQIPSFSFGLVNTIFGAILLALGFFYALWSIGLQLFKAEGTPVPIVPTQKLLVTPPFSHCRNPMAFGTITAYLGFAILAGSISSLLLVVVFALLLILYIKKIEEKELAMRFGQEYLEYKATTPFMIPGIFSRK
jgi:protein-S-isoprenylcysteine O-methyltransferase Ste14